MGHSRKTPTTLPCHYIPFPENRYFVGRRDVLRHIEAKLIKGGNGPNQSSTRAFALFAPPGYGKTQVARRFAAEHDAYFQSILWVFADSMENALNAFADFAVRMGLADKNASLTRKKAALWDWYQDTGQELQRLVQVRYTHIDQRYLTLCHRQTMASCF